VKLEVILASTRPGRVALPVGQWFFEHAKGHGGFEVALADLKEIDLPFLDEPKHPRLQQYEHEHTKRWSARIAAADAIAVVTPEYNFSAPAPLVNAFDFLYNEWNHKPIGFISYGGVSGGTRGVQGSRNIAAALKMVPIPEGIHIPFVHKFLNDEKQFVPNEETTKGADALLDQLVKWAQSLKAMRTPG